MPDRLRDIVTFAAELEDALTGRDVEDLADLTLLRAVERWLTLIGEAAKHVPDETRHAIDQPWRDIIRFRELGVHQYDKLRPERVFEIATRWVPALADAIRQHRGERP